MRNELWGYWTTRCTATAGPELRGEGNVHGRFLFDPLGTRQNTYCPLFLMFIFLGQDIGIFLKTSAESGEGVHRHEVEITADSTALPIHLEHTNRLS